MTKIKTDKEYIALFASLSDAIAFENSCLAVSREFLPQFAIVVLDGGESTPEYWTWLAEAYLQIV